MIIFNGGNSSSNKDTIYYDDNTDKYHFTQDTTKYAEGNAGIVCGDLTLTTGNLKLVDSSTPDGRSINYYEDDGTTQIGFVGQGSSGNKDLYMWGRAGNSLRLGAGNAERIRVEAGGDVGIGTDSPGAKLDVRGEVRGNRNTNTTSFFGRTAIGYCGHNDSCSIAHLDRNNTTDYTLLHNSAGTTYLNCKSDKTIRFRSGNTDKMRMLANGNFGINTTSPAQKLDVAGRIRADTMEIDSYIYHVGDTNTYFGFNGNDHFTIVEGGGTRFQVDSTGDIGIGRGTPKKKLDVAGTIGCAELFYGDTYTGYELSHLTCTKTRRSTGHPTISFTINAVSQVGWIPFTFQLYGTALNSNGSSQFKRIGEGHGRYYNGSHSTDGVSGVTFTVSQSGDKGTLTWNMDDYARNYTVFSVTLTCYEGVIS